MASDKDEELSLFRATIHRDPARRIDKYRANRPTVTSLHPATLKDAGRKIDAVAKVTHCSALSPQVMESMIENAEIHRRLHNYRAILKVHGVTVTERDFILFLEKGEGSLRDVLSPKTDETRALRDRLFTTMSRREVLRQIFQGLAYIHSQTDAASDKISHRDIKPDNLLLVEHERDGTLSIKFSDFDSAKQLEVGDEMEAVTTQAFTALYKDPHLDEKIEAGLPVVVDDYVHGDVYALGILTHDVLRDGEHLFRGKNQLATMVNMRNTDRKNLIDADCDELGKNLIWTMTEPNPDDRVSVEEALKSPYFTDENDHLQAWNAVGEVLLNLRDAVTSGKINRKFFMVFKKKWKSLPFVVPEILRFSTYGDTWEDFHRYCRNMIIHAGQHEDALRRHFGRKVSAADLLGEILQHAPRALVHLYWVAQSFLPQLSLNHIIRLIHLFGTLR